jgi:hypothetical protein
VLARRGEIEFLASVADNVARLIAGLSERGALRG